MISLASVFRLPAARRQYDPLPFAPAFMSDYEVRPAIQGDAKAIAEVHAAAAKAAYTDILPEDQLRALAPSTREAKWREAIEFSEPQVQVAVLGEEVVGFVGYDRSRDAKTPSTTGEIWAIYVKPVSRWTGLYMAVIEPQPIMQLQMWPLTDESMKELRGARGIERLHLASPRITDEGLKEVATIKGLQLLYLYGTAVTDKGLAHLAVWMTARQMYEF